MSAVARLLEGKISLSVVHSLSIRFKNFPIVIVQEQTIWMK